MPGISPNLMDGLPGLPSFNAPAPPAPPKQDDFREFADVDAARRNIYDQVLQAASASPPVQNQLHTLRLSGVEYVDPDRFSKKDQKNAILGGQTLGRRMRGTWELLDNATGQVIDSKKSVIGSVPYLSERGTYIHGGNEYTLRNQQRLRPGVFTRQKENGEIEAHANILPGQGVSHRYFLDPEKGVFYLRLQQAKLPLMPLVKAMGATPKQLQEAWGGSLYAANYAKDEASAFRKLKEKLLKPEDLESDDETAREKLVRRFAEMKLDPEVTARTMTWKDAAGQAHGQAHSGLTLDAILDITKKLVAVSRGEIKVDDRDALPYQQFLGPEDLFAERVSRDHGRIRRQLLWKASGLGGLAKLPSSALKSQIESTIISSGLGQALEEINPAEIYDKLHSISRLGEGGIPSMDAVPDEARNVQPSHMGYMDPLRTPESFKVGVDLYLSRGARKGRDGKVYSQFKDPRTGQTIWKTPQEIADLSVTFPSALAKYRGKRVPALKDGELSWVKKQDIDLVLPNFEDTFSPLGNMVPLKSMVKGQRVAMASRMLTQALPLQDGEAPLVQSAIPGSKGSRSYEEEYANRMGALRSNQPGRVLSVSPDEVRVRYADGSEEAHELYQNFPFNRKTYLHQTPVVKTGDVFKAGDLLARSNYTDSRGATALGKNLRVAYIPWGGKNFEDAVVISEDAAKAFSSEHMYQHELDVDDRTKVGLKEYLGLFPGKFDKKTLQKLDKRGVIQPGMTVEYGDPLVLAARERDRADNKVHRKRQAGYVDSTITWDHHDPGVVTDVVDGKNGPVVLVKSLASVRLGDKLSGRYGDKGVVAAIVPDNQMPHDADGRPFQVLLNPLGIISRCYDEQTEFLTEDGWTFGRDVRNDVKFVCYHPWTEGLFVLPQLAEFYRTRYSGPMLTVQNKLVDFCVTPNHRMWARSCYPGAPWREMTASRIYGKNWAVPVAGKPVPGVDSPFTLPHLAYLKKDTATCREEIVIDAGDWAEFLGWYVAEGSANDKAHISQSWKANPEKCEWIQLLLARLPFKFWYSKKNGQFHVTSKRLATYLKQYGLCHQKSIPAWVFQQSAETRQRFLDAYWAGDGHVHRFDDGRKTSSATTRSRRLADDLQRLLAYQGVSANVYPVSVRKTNKPMWRCAWHFQRTRMLEDKNWATIPYDGMIYCPTVPTGYIVTRRNGKILIAGNTNPAQQVEAMLGKIAAKRGEPYRVDDWQDGRDATEWALSELQKAGLSDTEDIVDPSRDRKIKGVATGVRYFMKLQHTAESKGQARGGGAYTQEDAPAKGGPSGSKRVALLDTNALLAHGATETLRDVGAIRGQRNEEYWMQFMQGYNPGKPKVPMVYEKFVNQLKAAGVNVVRSGTQTNVMALTNADVNHLAGDREITSGATVRWDKDLKPIKGGLFDKALTGGHNGNRWSFIRLHEPMPNPVMEEPIRRMLNLTGKEFEGVLSGDRTIPNHGTGPQAIVSALSDIDVDREIQVARGLMHEGNKGERDMAVRRLGYLKSAKAMGLHPKDWVLDKAPVLPPAFRPISMMQNNVPLVSDPNYLYKELLDANQNLSGMKKELGEEGVGQERLAVYHAFKAVTGMGDPISQKSREKNVRGILQSIFGSSPKFGTVQRKLISTTVDNVGRAVVTPNPDFDMDTCGLPEDKAFDIYGRFIARRLKRSGMPLRQALEHIHDRTKTARNALIEEMDARPVYINRAPVLHKFGILAFKPKLIQGDALQVSPLIVKGFNMDFDGDAVQFHVPTDAAASREAEERLLPSRSLLSPADFKTPVHMPSNEYLGGLYHASNNRSKRPKAIFRTKAEAVAAYERGTLNADDPVTILET